MKILIVAPWIRLGGADILAVNLAANLNKLGHTTHIVTLFVDTKGLPPVARTLDYITPPKMVSKLCLKYRLFFLVTAPILLTIEVVKHSRNADLLNPHNFPGLWACAFTALFRKIPIVWTCNEPPPFPRMKDIPTIGLPDFIGWCFASSIIDRLIVRLTNCAIIVPSEKTKQDVFHRYAKHAHIVHIGVDDVLFRSGKKIASVNGISIAGKFVILCVGKIHPQKNQLVALLAFSKFVAKVPNSVLLFIGSGPMEEQLKAAIDELGLAPKAKILGTTSLAMLVNLYASSTVNLFPAVDHQSWGMTPIEGAIAGSIPIVSSQTGVAPIVANAGFGLSVPSDPNHFFAALMQVYTRPRHAHKMISNASRYIPQFLTWQVYAHKNAHIMERWFSGQSQHR